MLKLNLFMRSFLLAMALLSWGGGAAAADTRYVSDQLVITLRAGQGDQYRILRTLISGTRLEILEEQGEFARVRIANGEEGWVRTQYLLDAPTAKLVLKEVSDKLARYEQENKVLRQELSQLKQDHSALQQQAGTVEKEYKRLTQEHTNISQIAQRPMELDKENRQLRQEAEVITSELQTLRSENSKLKKNTTQQWFLAGGGVLLLGVLLGIILPKLRLRRQGGWS